MRLFLVSILPILVGSNLNVNEWTPGCFGWCRFPLCFCLWQLSPATKAKYLSWYEMEGPVKPKTGKQARCSQCKWGGQLVLANAKTGHYYRGSQPVLPWKKKMYKDAYICQKPCFHAGPYKGRMQLQFIWCKSADEYRICNWI